MITSPAHSDPIEVSARQLHVRGAVPAIAAVACIVASAALWHLVIGTALAALRQLPAG
jgi:hypothetical protein